MLQLEASREECGNLATKLAAGEARVQDAERRTEALATLQSHRWMEFSKMADNMKELSGTMVSQLMYIMAIGISRICSKILYNASFNVIMIFQFVYS